MSKKTDRRAAERDTRKLAYQQLRQERAQSAIINPAADSIYIPELELVSNEQHPSELLARAHAFFAAESVTGVQPAEPTEPTTPQISALQLAANQANAKLSCGPKSIEGKSTSSMNALKHGLTSKTIVLPGEDQSEYNSILTSYNQTFKPSGNAESRLIQSMLDCDWRLTRLLHMESAVLLKGHKEFADKFEDEIPSQRSAFIWAEVYLKYEKSLRNLQLQESRLRRTREKDNLELTRLQTIRRREERIAAEAEQSATQPQQTSPAVNVATANGFVLSTPQAPHRKPFSKAA